MTARIAPLLVTVAALAISAPAAGLPTAPATHNEDVPPARVEELIRQLGSDKHAEREAASRRLLHAEGAAPALRRALSSSEREVARRARAILGAFERRRQARALERLKAAAKAGDADLVAEGLACWGGGDGDAACWQAALDLGWRVVDYDRKGPKRVSDERSMPQRDFARFLWDRRPRALPPGRPDLKVPRGGPPRGLPDIGQFLARGERLVIGARATSSLFAASESAHLGRVGGTFVFAGGPVRLEFGSRVVVFSDGDVEFGLAPGSRDNDDVGAINSVLVARGAVRCPPGMQNCLVLAGGDVTVPEGATLVNTTLRSARDVRVPKSARLIRNTATERQVKGVFGPVRFFETTNVGVEAAPCKFAVRVTAVDGKKAFAKAGLKVGDLVTSLNASEATTPERFRRLLRRAIADGSAAAELRVRRGDQWLTVRVPLGG
jgi:hypothetical protein